MTDNLVDCGHKRNHGKRTHGHGQQCGDCGREEGWKGTNGNGKKYIIFKNHGCTTVTSTEKSNLCLKSRKRVN